MVFSGGVDLVDGTAALLVAAGAILIRAAFDRRAVEITGRI
ncbi:MAG TPA: hypothetical protein VIX83_02490 [Candidatus Cybelea sp.]